MGKIKHTAAVVLAAATVSGATFAGSIISSFNATLHEGSTSYAPQGITYGGGYIWNDYWGPALWRVVKRNAESGSIIATIYLLGEVAVGALGYDEARDQLWGGILNGGAARWTTAGSFVSSFGPPPGFTSLYYMIDYNENAPTRPLWFGEYKYPASVLIANATTAGSVTSSFNINTPGGYAMGLAYDGDTAGGPFLFVSVRHWAGDRIYKINPNTGSIISSFGVAVYENTIYDLSWDGRYLWCLARPQPGYADAWAFRFVAHEYPAVAPASLGKIKALFQ